MTILIYALRRTLQAVPVILIIMVGTFLLLKLAPGDTVDALVGDMGGANAEFIARLRADAAIEPGQPAPLAFNMTKAVFFAPQTTARLR